MNSDTHRIETIAHLAERLGIETGMLAMVDSKQQVQFMREYITQHEPEMRVIGRGANGKGTEFLCDAFERITGERLDGKGKRRGLK